VGYAGIGLQTTPRARRRCHLIRDDDHRRVRDVRGVVPARGVTFRRASEPAALLRQLTVLPTQAPCNSQYDVHGSSSGGNFVPTKAPPGLGRATSRSTRPLHELARRCFGPPACAKMRALLVQKPWRARCVHALTGMNAFMLRAPRSLAVPTGRPPVFCRGAIVVAWGRVAPATSRFFMSMRNQENRPRPYVREVLVRACAAPMDGPWPQRSGRTTSVDPRLEARAS